jgi:hypothetical protein
VVGSSPTMTVANARRTMTMRFLSLIPVPQTPNSGPLSEPAICCRALAFWLPARGAYTARSAPCFLGSEQTQDGLVGLVGEREGLHRELLLGLQRGQRRAFLVDVGQCQQVRAVVEVLDGELGEVLAVGQ